MSDESKKDCINVRVKVHPEYKTFADKLSGKSLDATVTRESKIFSSCKLAANISKITKR